eukprot:137554_1
MSRQKQTKLKPEFNYKNQEANIYSIEAIDEACDAILNLSRQNLSCIPFKIAKEKANDIHTLILTSNKLCSFRYLAEFQSLTTLQLDGNQLSDESFACFPKLKSLNTLWLNNNNLRNLDDLLSILARACPKLEYLSLLFNPLCPFTRTDDGRIDGRCYLQYRDKVLSHLPSLKYLDILGVNTGPNAIEFDGKAASLILSVIEVNTASLHQSILDESHMKRIIYHCAARTHFVEWTCCYNSVCHGFSKHTFTSKINAIKSDKSLLIMRDQRNHVFGAYIDGAKWYKSFHYKGSCDGFVFHYGGRYTERNHNLYVHKATCREPYYLQRNHADVTIGRGEAAAIYFDMDFNHGTTTHCKTFDSPPLTPRTDFKIHSFEIWTPNV